MEKILDIDGNELAEGDTVLVECTVSQLLPLEGEGGFNLRVITSEPKIQIALNAKQVTKKAK